MLGLSNTDTAKAAIVTAKTAFRASVMQACAQMETQIARALGGLTPEEREQVYPASDRAGVKAALDGIQKCLNTDAPTGNRSSR